MFPSKDEVINDPCEYMARLAQSILPLTKWGFIENIRLAKEIIYDSKHCRISIVWGNWDYLGGSPINVYYGRLHAPNQQITMNWNSEECRCWHRLELALHFLDSSTPKLTEKKKYSHSLKDKYKQSELGQSLTGKRRQPEWLLHMHSTIWDHYAPRLFELFDLRRPELWEQYRMFLRECYVSEGGNEEDDKKNGIIPYYQVC